jgi:O-antigen/teichoic acid export membrane protein
MVHNEVATNIQRRRRSSRGVLLIMHFSHISWNTAGLVLPLIVAAFTVPDLIERLGSERFGLLALAWGLIGYAGVLDLGIGRALTQMVARLRGEGNLTPIPNVLATAGRITQITGLAGGVLIVLTVLLGGYTWIKTQGVPSSEVRNAMLLLAIALPVQAMSATYRGMNEAYLNFKDISLVRVGLGVVSFGGPYLVAFYTTDMFWLVATLVGSRLIALLFFHRLANACLEDGKSGGNDAAYSPQIAKSLFHFGWWATVSSVLSPLLVQSDRFVIAAVISTAAVTVYVVPYEVVAQSLVLVGAVSSVMFPTLSKMLQEQPDDWQAYFRRWLALVAGMMFLVCTLLAIFLPTIFHLWLKEKFVPESVVIGQVLCLGVFANAIGSMYYALLHAKGRADLTAKLHLIELPLFILLLMGLLHQFGLMGAAWAWVGRMVFDAIFLAWCSRGLYA